MIIMQEPRPYQAQVKKGLDGDHHAALKARVILHDLPAPITLTPRPAKGDLWASYRLNPAALIKGAGYRDRSEAICPVSAVAVKVRTLLSK